ncbi:MAG: ATP-dependent RNA helicase HrpA [Candidatus Latescibacterota bacterium]
MSEPTAVEPVSPAHLKELVARCLLRDRRRLQDRLRAWQRSSGNAAELQRLCREAERSARLVEERRRRRPKVTYPEELPISARREEIRRAVEQHPVVIVAGETGSGKTTQLPKICLEAGRGLFGTIACTQPRRVAALSISRRIAHELGVTWGREVGCKIRFTDETSPHTLVKMVTDGMLLAEIQGDRQLLEYDTIIVDEAHERSLNVDYLLGYLKILRRQRPELRVIVTSATIDTEAFSRAFDNAPVIEVSGRVFPVEVRYRPLDELLAESGDYTYTDAAVQAVEEVIAESPRGGDLLVFLPTEADIRETCDRLEGRRLRGVEILPLFGRLTSAEQQRVFAPGERRRVVVATNIAETSLTIPRIHYVVDTGLARVTRFNPRTRTQGLPIEPISQSSADQRRGRCGRVADGICIRLYEEADYQSRPRYTQPEIQRADLADVILHMTAQRLGQVETFPFIDPPSAQAVRGGYQLLQELGALDADHRLTRLGRELARLPIAPTDARMILQARQEGALRELLVIAAALGIQDPRERPLEQQDEADQMHRQFAHPESDFLALLKIWNAYHDQLEAIGTQSGMRKFCRAHFLSFIRMREWRDIHAQLQQLVEEFGGFTLNDEPAEYAAVHRSVLSGLLSNIARVREGNLYQAARGREVMLFPGSGLFRRRPRRRSGPAKPATAERETAGPEWIVAAEVVETSRLYARTVARIDAEWLADLGEHLCRSSYKEPYWNPRSGRVLVQETLTLYGLEVLTRKVGYGRINPREATEIFIREALVPGAIQTPHGFLEHNLRLFSKLETWQTRVSRHAGVDLSEAAVDFYRTRLEEVSSIHDLNRVVGERTATEPRFLYMSERDLLAGETGFDGQSFPDALVLDDQALPISYAYRPGQEDDGVTVRVPYRLIHAVAPEVLEWLVPGLLEEKVTCLLRSLPKALRKELVPIPEKARAIAARLRPTHPTFLESLEAFIRAEYRLQIRRPDWDLDEVPEHLRLRVEVAGEDARPVDADRDLDALVRRLERHDTPAELEAWTRAAAQWEQEGLTAWTFGDLPVRIQVAEVAGVPLLGYPGLVAGPEAASLRLFKNEEEARLASRDGVARLAAYALREQLAWVGRQLQELSRFKLLCRTLAPMAELRQAAQAHLEDHLFRREELYPLEQVRFEALVTRAGEEVRTLVPRFLEQLGRLLELRHQLLVHPHPHDELQAELQRLVPADLLRQVPFARLGHLCRYLQAVLRRAERARLQPGKDEQMAARVRPYQARLDRLRAEPLSPLSPRRALIEELRWLVEEYRVSVFAQELGTAEPVSDKRLERKLAEIEACR